jgi:tight adherence protein B
VRIVQGFLVLVVAAVLVWHWGVGSTFLAVGALVFLTLTVRARRGRRLEELIRTDTRHVVRTLHDESASGATVIDALAAARDESRYHRGELGEAVNRTVRGHNPVDALATNPQLRPIALSLSVSADAGSSLCAVLSGLDRQLAGEEAGREALAVALAGPRSSASLLGLLPVGGLMLGTVLGVDPLAVLMHTHTGQLALIVGLVLNGVGALWTARLIAAACR